MKQKTNIKQFISALTVIVLMTFVPACATQPGIASGSNQAAQTAPQSAASTSGTNQSPFPITGIDALGRAGGY
jgi:hypothetical protein